MNIPAVSPVNSVSYNNKNDDDIKLLENQKKQLQEQLQQIQQSDQDAATKQSKAQQVQNQISQLDRQIEQKKQENRKDTQTENQLKNQQNKEFQDGGDFSGAYQTNLIHASASYSKAKSISSTNAVMEAKSKELSAYAQSDQGMSPTRAAREESQAQALQSRVYNSKNDLAAALNDSRQKTEKTSEGTGEVDSRNIKKANPEKDKTAKSPENDEKASADEQ